MAMGFVTSPRAARVLDFLRRAGPCPFPALRAATGLDNERLAKALRHLRRAGFAAPVRLRNGEFWATDGASFDLETQETLAWFAARLEEAGGRYEEGVAKFPKGQVLPVRPLEGRVEVGEFVFFLHDLREKPLRECFRRRAS